MKFYLEEYIFMETLDKAENGIIKMMMEKRFGSKTAEGVALQRLRESVKPESERICYDRYAAYLIDPNVLEFIHKNPYLVRTETEKYEMILPGMFNSIIARVRYFDDFVNRSIYEGFEQIVIMGAGYDTRAYRIEGIKKLKVFEMDHSDTQSIKIERLKKIFDPLPEHVIFIPIDFETGILSQRLIDSGFDKSKKTLFIMEGLVMYLTPESVDETLFFIANNSGKGSAIIFDYYPKSVVDITCKSKCEKNIRDFMARHGEPLKFGIEEGKVETFLSKRGFSQIHNVAPEDYKNMYFHGVNENRTICFLLYFVHATIK
jgi:methyltransferase (TIGR00027 family)